jgi:hypothetical protein
VAAVDVVEDGGELHGDLSEVWSGRAQKEDRRRGQT